MLTKEPGDSFKQGANQGKNSSMSYPAVIQMKTMLSKQRKLYYIQDLSLEKYPKFRDHILYGKNPLSDLLRPRNKLLTISKEME